MNSQNRSADFNLFLAAEALFGILDALHQLGEHVPDGQAEQDEWNAKLSGLAWNGLQLARELRAFLCEASDMHRFPCRWDQLQFNGVREMPAIYAIR